MKRKVYTHDDFVKEYFKTPAQRRAYERGVRRLLIAHKIADLRERAHMTQAQLARKLHTKQQVISRLEQDRYQPSFRTLEKIAAVFGKRVEINFV